MVQKAFENTERMSFSYILNFPLILFLNLTLSFRKKKKTVCIWMHGCERERDRERDEGRCQREHYMCGCQRMAFRNLFCLSTMGSRLNSSHEGFAVSTFTHSVLWARPSCEAPNIIFNIIYLFLFPAHSCFACMPVCIKVSDPLKVELQADVSCHAGVGN